MYTFSHRYDRIYMGRMIMKNYLYEVILNDGTKYIEYRYDRAVEIFNERGTRMYFRTKNLFPVRALAMWK